MIQTPPILLFSIIIITLSFWTIYTNKAQLNTTKPNELAPIDQINEKSINNLPSGNDQITVRGKIVKEIIPANLELGETWYWMYFDTPFFLKDNASGLPQYIDKIEVNPPSEKAGDSKFDTKLNKHIEVVGELTWGYAESRVIQIISTKEIN